MLNLTIKPISETAVRQFLTWKYEPPYHVYDMSRTNKPDVTRALQYFLNPDYEFYLLYNDADELVGFFSFGSDAQVPGGDYTGNAVDIGLAVRPDYTGRGLGIHFARSAANHAIATHQPPRLRVTIAEFNQRAQKVWRRLGFMTLDSFRARGSHRPFIIMAKELTNEINTV